MQSEWNEDNDNDGKDGSNFCEGDDEYDNRNDDLEDCVGVDRPVTAERIRQRGEFGGWSEEVEGAVQNGTMTIC
jgi:hypothetical protein